MIGTRLGTAVLAVLGIAAETLAYSTSINPNLANTYLEPYKTINLLPNGPLQLYPYDFASNTKECTDSHVLSSNYDAFALPFKPQQLQIVFQGAVWCEDGAVSQQGTLLGLGALNLVVNCIDRALVVNGGNMGELYFFLPLINGRNDLNFTLVVDGTNAEQPLSLCNSQGRFVNGVDAGLQQFLSISGLYSSEEESVLSKGISVGPRSTQQPAARATLSTLLLVTSKRPLQTCLSDVTALLESPSNTPKEIPNIVELQAKPAAGGEGLEVEQEVQIVARAGDVDGDQLQLSVTVYGLPPAGCEATECGDATFFAPMDVSSSSGVAEVSPRVKFPIPGRFIIRARVSDGSGEVITKDLAVVVYKKGDTQRLAPCCRHTPYIVGHNLGRPIDRLEFRSASGQAAANRLGWPPSHWSTADLEAERLFDYGILAPSLLRYPVDVLTCADVRLAGGGSPEVYGLLSSAKEVLGHAKQLTIVPETFPWASGASDVACQEHWSQWPDNKEAGEYRRPVPSTNRTCCVGCTAAGVQTLIKSTGMVDQYNQALVQLSHGALALSPNVRVLPEVQVAKEALNPGDSSSNYSYYDTPARMAVESAPGSYPWMRLTLAPLALHKIPKHRAWSGGITSGAATITNCFASMYYAVHETGHRLGFRHGSLWQLAAGHAVPANPLGAGQFVKDESYGQRLDIMSCCRSDFGIFHRSVAGWLKGSARVVISQAELEQPSTKKLIIWPFDRSESRGKLLTVAIRRSENELLLIGFRSASHWQENLGKETGNRASPEETRLNIRGVQVEFIRRNPENGNEWTERGILDFNVLHGEWPHALPAGPGELARMSEFSLLKEGHSWFDPGSRLLLSLQRIGDCDGQAEIVPHNHTALNFYGFRGEWPGSEAFAQGDYAGYAGLECAHVTLSTVASPPQGKLPITVSYQKAEQVGALKKQNKKNNQTEVCRVDGAPGGSCEAPPRGGDGGSPGGGGSNNSSDNNSGSGSGGNSSDNNKNNNNNKNNRDHPPPSPAKQTLQLTVSWPEGINITAVVWKDRWNRTIAAPLSEQLQGRTRADVSVLPEDLPASVHVLAADGRHVRAELGLRKKDKKDKKIGSLSLNSPSPSESKSDPESGDVVHVWYRFYEPDVITQEEAELGTLSVDSPVQLGGQKSSLYFILAIVGSLVGGLVLFIALLVWVIRRRRRRQRLVDGAVDVSSSSGTERRRTTTPAALAAAAAENEKQATKLPVSK